MSNLKKSVAIALGATFAAGLAATPLANAAENPFGMKSLDSGYQQLAAGNKDGKYKEEGKCGEGKCGDAKKEMKKEKTKEKKKQAEGEEVKEMEQEQEQEMQQTQ